MTNQSTNTSQELIPITNQTIGNVETMSCDARALYEFMEVESKFADWIKNRIEKYGFLENQDYLAFSKNLENGGRTKEYVLTLDMAKQLAMVENNDKGMMVRRYFIKREQDARRMEQAISSPKSRRSLEEVTARSLAVTLRKMANQKVYPDEMKAVFLAEAASTLSGNPMSQYLPPCVSNQEKWLMATQIAEYFGPKMHANTIGKALKNLNLHGENDLEHEWSRAVWDKSPYSVRQVSTYVYNPDVVIPALSEYFAVKDPEQDSVVLPFEPNKKVVN